MTAGSQATRAGTESSAGAKNLRRLGVLLSALVVGFGVWAELSEPWFVGDVRNAVFDAYQRSHPRPYRPAPVRIVDIDEETLSKLGQWPWPRTKVAELVSKLRDMGAASIAFDIIFAEPDRTSPSWLAGEWADKPDVAAVLSELPDHDEALAAEMAKGNVVTAFALTEEASAATPLNRGRFVRVGAQQRVTTNRYEGAVPSLPALEEAASGNGAINFSPDRDGVVRRVPMLVEKSGTLYPSLLAEALRIAANASSYTLVAEDRGSSTDSAALVALRTGRFTVPTDTFGRTLVYLTRPQPERYVSAWKIMEDQADGLLPEGAIVFVGSSATGLQDLRFGPLGKVIPGVEIHAQLAEQVLLDVYATRPLWVQGLESLVVILGWLLILAFGSRPRALSATLAAVGVLASIGASAVYAWYTWAILADPVFPNLVLAATFLAYTVPRQLAAESEGRWIRDVFANYLSPNLVEHLIRNPGELRLGGERRECSFVLTDVAGFTTLVEGMDPHELTETINGYLEGMVSIAFEHDGTLDRIVGDAVAVLFSAPVAQPDHPERAVRCALAMDRFAREYSRRCHERDIPFGLTRIGVHTGEVVVGNFGGTSHFDYRPLGDPINTAARLETANRHLGTRVCVSEATVSRCPAFTGRPAGTLVLKGKKKGVDVFEALAEEENASPKVQAYRAAFESMRREDDSALAEFRALASGAPDDGLVAFHLSRLERGEKGTLVVLSEK